jgi:hypothetical protein
MQELYDRLCELEDRHDYIKNDIYDTRVAMQQQKEGRTPLNKGDIARRLTAYRNDLDLLKQEINETIRLIPAMDKPTTTLF